MLGAKGRAGVSAVAICQPEAGPRLHVFGAVDHGRQLLRQKLSDSCLLLCVVGFVHLVLLDLFGDRNDSCSVTRASHRLGQKPMIPPVPRLVQPSTLIVA